MPHANPQEKYPSAVLRRLLIAEQLTYAEIRDKFGTNYPSVCRWVRTGNISPPTYKERALKRWRIWKDQERDPLHTPEINQRRSEGLRKFYKNHPAAAKKRKPPAQENGIVQRGSQRGKGVVADEDTALYMTARSDGRLGLLPDQNEKDLLDARFDRGESLRAIAEKWGDRHPFSLSRDIKGALFKLRGFS